MIGNEPNLAGHLEQARAPLPLLPQRRPALPAGAAAAAGRARRTRGSGWRTAPSRRARSTTSSSISSGSNRIDSAGGASSASGSRTTMPSSVYIVWTSRPSRSRTRASMAWAHGAWTCAPNGEWMHTRQSPSSSRKRSTTMVRSSGSTPVASRCSSRYRMRFRAASSSSPAAAQPAAGAARASGASSSREERAQRPPELDRPARRVAVPERHLARDPRAPARPAPGRA